MKRILIIRLDGLGDTLLTLPLLDGLKECWPECEITYLASARGAPVLAGDARIAHLWTLELADLSKAEKKALGEKIRSAAFELVFCLNEKFWPAMWTWKSGAPVRIGFDPGWIQLPKTLLRRLTLTHRLPDPNDPARVSIHEVERYSALGRLAGCLAAAGPLRLHLPQEAREWAAAKTAACALPSGTIPIGLHLSAKWSAEGWSDQICVEVARSLLNRFPDIFLIVTAGPGEERYFASAAAVLPTSRFALFTGLQLAQWAALLSQTRGLVSMDTGAVHLAASVATPVVAVFPELNFAHASSRWSPWQVPHRVIRRPSPAQADIFLAEICSALEDLL